MAELKAQLYLLEKEKKSLELKLSSQEAQEQAYLVHIEHLKSEVEEQQEQRRSSFSSTGRSTKDKSAKVSYKQTHSQRLHPMYFYGLVNTSDFLFFLLCVMYCRKMHHSFTHS